MANPDQEPMGNPSTEQSLSERSGEKEESLYLLRARKKTIENLLNIELNKPEIRGEEFEKIKNEMAKAMLKGRNSDVKKIKEEIYWEKKMYRDNEEITKLQENLSITNTKITEAETRNSNKAERGVNRENKEQEFAQNLLPEELSKLENKQSLSEEELDVILSDLYKILGVERNASQEDIRAAFGTVYQEFRSLGKNKTEEHEKVYQIIHSAYNTLSDEKRRVEYDKKLKDDEEKQNAPATMGARQEEPKADADTAVKPDVTGPVAPQVEMDQKRKAEEVLEEAFEEEQKEKVVEEAEHIEYLEYIGDSAAMGLAEPKISEMEWKKQKIEKELIELEKELEETSKKIEKETNLNLKAALEDESKMIMDEIGKLEEKLEIIEAKIQEESGGWEEQKVAWELGKSVGKGALKGGWWLTKKGAPVAGKGAVLGLAAFGVLIKDLWKLAKIETKIAWKGITGHKVSLLEGWREVFKKEEATK